MRKFLFPLLLVLLTIIGGVYWVAQSDPTDRDPIKVAYLPIGAGLPIFVAEEQGFFDEQGLSVDLIEFKTSNDIAAAGLSGRVDVIGTGATNAMLDANSNANGQFRLFLANNYVKRADGQSTDFVIARSDSNVENYADFKGRTVAIFPGSVGEVFLAAVSPKLGLEPDEVETVAMPPAQWLPSLQSGSIDGVFGAVEPFATFILDEGVGEIIVDGYYAELMPDVPASGAWFISQKLTEDEERRFYAAIQKAVRFIATDEVAARQALAGYTAIPAEKLSRIRLQEWRMSGDDGMSETLRTFAETFYRQGGLAEQPTSDDWIWKP
ncbi:ABC transporter substrate-binding protein [Qipengyuania sp. ASV99]|uniref:ABC transporter substrate-binding protein n=1 Tax=Qipengyuania sp. ASV99 TaxID=3399681 RepID=UPI003A4C7881